MTYGTCNMVLSICVYADPNQFKPVAIVVPVEAALRKFAIAKGLASHGTSFEDLAQDMNVVASVYAEILSIGKRAGLTGMELIQGVVLVVEEWTPENVYPVARDTDYRNYLLRHESWGEGAS